jgi:hypothetical protein
MDYSVRFIAGEAIIRSPAYEDRFFPTLPCGQPPLPNHLTWFPKITSTIPGTGNNETHDLNMYLSFDAIWFAPCGSMNGDQVDRALGIFIERYSELLSTRCMP